MDILQIVMPVLVMIILGMLCRKWKILTGEGVANMKVLVTNVMLPVAIFHALATAEYNKETGIYSCIRCQYRGTEEDVLEKNEMIRFRYKAMHDRITKFDFD